MQQKYERVSLHLLLDYLLLKRFGGHPILLFENAVKIRAGVKSTIHDDILDLSLWAPQYNEFKEEHNFMFLFVF